jgi:hypothetical protein
MNRPSGAAVVPGRPVFLAAFVFLACLAAAFGAIGRSPVTRDAIPSAVRSPGDYPERDYMGTVSPTREEASADLRHGIVQILDDLSALRTEGAVFRELSITPFGIECVVVGPGAPMLAEQLSRLYPFSGSTESLISARLGEGDGPYRLMFDRPRTAPSLSLHDALRLSGSANLRGAILSLLIPSETMLSLRAEQLVVSFEADPDSLRNILDRAAGNLEAGPVGLFLSMLCLGISAENPHRLEAEIGFSAYLSIPAQLALPDTGPGIRPETPDISGLFGMGVTTGPAIPSYRRPASAPNTRFVLEGMMYSDNRGVLTAFDTELGDRIFVRYGETIRGLQWAEQQDGVPVCVYQGRRFAFRFSGED